MEFSAQQVEAVEKIRDWYYTEPESQVFRLFGYAGTGKSTLARYIAEYLGVGLVLFAAYTGKAAHVLRTKGCHSASTIHSLIYQPVEKTRAKLAQLKADRADKTDSAEIKVLDRLIRIEEEKLLTPDFILREDSALKDADLLILDEVSMVNEEMAADLLSFGKRLLVLGDPAQLPPVGGGGHFTNRTPDHFLSEIHRSALDSPVTRLATTVRTSQPGTFGYGIHLNGACGRREYVDDQELSQFDQVLVGRNTTRWGLIHRIRELNGLSGVSPLAGDRIIILANSRDNNVFNGQQFEVLECRPHPRRDDRLCLRVLDPDNRTERLLTVWTAGFLGVKGEEEVHAKGRGEVAAATFAQAITVHKAQGSQWDRVLVFDEAHVFTWMARNNGHSPAEIYRAGQRWLYTAITRAAEQVVIVKR